MPKRKQPERKAKDKTAKKVAAKDPKKEVAAEPVKKAKIECPALEQLKKVGMR